MSNDFDSLAAASAAAAQPGDVPEIRISAADRPPGDRRREEPQAPGSTAARAPLLKRAGKTGAALAACALVGLAGWGLYGVVAPQSAGWLAFIAAKTAPPVDLVPVTQKLQAEIEALQKKVETLEKSRSANTKALASVEKSVGALDGMSRRLDETKTETKAEIETLSGRVAALQQETNAKLAELSAAHPLKKHGAEAVSARQHQAARRYDAFDPAQHPGAPGAPRPLGVP